MDPQVAPPAAGAAAPPPAAPPAPAGAAAVPPQNGAQPPQAAAPQDPSKPAQPPAAPNAQAQPGAPADIVIKLPEGTQADQSMLDGFKSTAKKIGVTQEQAQAIADFWFKAAQDSTKAVDLAFKQQLDRDTETLRGDKDFGGARYDKTVTDAKSALVQFFGEDGSKLFTELGLQNNPAIVKGLARVRQAIAEDSIAGKTHAAPAANDRTAQLKAMFPNSPGMFAP